MVQVNTVICGPSPGLLRLSMAAAAAAPPMWYDPIVATLTAGGAQGHLWLHDHGVSVAVGAPVAYWLSTDGEASWEQPGASSLCPLLQADGLAFDGIDDRQLAGASTDTLLAGSTWTFALGAPSAVASASRAYWATTDGSTSNRYNAVTNNDLGASAAGSGVSLFGAATASPPMGVWFSRSGATYVRRLGAVYSVGSWPSSPTGLQLLTLGARRAPSAGVFYSGKISWVLLTTRALNTTEMGDIASILAANGYPT